MSTTRITIVKIAGHLGEAINQLFYQHWSDIKYGDIKYGKLLEDSLRNARVQDKSISDKFLSLTHTLESHCDCASVVWFQQFVDNWTLGPCHDVIDEFEVLAGQFKVILSDSVDVLLLTASDREVARCLKGKIVNSRNQRGYSPELRYFLRELRHCAISWQPFLESNRISTIKLVFFHALGPSRLDHDIIKMAGITPDWFQGPEQGGRNGEEENRDIQEEENRDIQDSE